MISILLKKKPPEWENQLHVLNKTNYLKYVRASLFLGFFLICSHPSPISKFSFYARLSFASYLCLYDSFDFLFLQEVRMSNEALKYHLSDMDTMRQDF